MKISREELGIICDALATNKALCDATMSFSRDPIKIEGAVRRKEKLENLIDRISMALSLDKINCALAAAKGEDND